VGEDAAALVDTVLLGSALVLAWIAATDAGTGALALAKIIGLGGSTSRSASWRLRPGRSRPVRAVAGLAALGVVAWIVSVATTKSPLGFLGAWGHAAHLKRPRFPEAARRRGLCRLAAAREAGGAATRSPRTGAAEEGRSNEPQECAGDAGRCLGLSACVTPYGPSGLTGRLQRDADRRPDLDRELQRQRQHARGEGLLLLDLPLRRAHAKNGFEFFAPVMADDKAASVDRDDGWSMRPTKGGGASATYIYVPGSSARTFRGRRRSGCSSAAAERGSVRDERTAGHGMLRDYVVRKAEAGPDEGRAVPRRHRRQRPPELTRASTGSRRADNRGLPVRGPR
jgi:hypothetical protein